VARHSRLPVTSQRRTPSWCCRRRMVAHSARIIHH
jgi:hypothetical protein